MATGNDLLRLAETRIGEKYVNVLVPKDNPNWHGPWDCAEFASWVVYQTVHRLYGCTDNTGNPTITEAYSGAWVRDATNKTLQTIDRHSANITPGAILIRRPPVPGKMGHIAISDGKGGTVEAAGSKFGVKRGKIEGRDWDYFALIPGVTYNVTDAVIRPKPLPYLLKLQDPCISNALVKKVQIALKQAGIDPGNIDGIYGPKTVVAVCAFQISNKLIADGVVGPVTAKKLRITWE